MPELIDLKQLERRIKKVTVLRFPFIIRCNRKYSLKPIRIKLDKIILDTNTLLDCLIPRWCEDGYPLWYPSTSLLIKGIVKKMFKIYVSEYTVNQVTGMINSWFRKKEEARERIENFSELCKKLKIVPLTTSEILERGIEYSKKYNISPEDGLIVYSAGKGKIKVIVTRDIEMIESRKLRKDFAVVVAENIVGEAPEGAYLRERWRKTPQDITKQLQEGIERFLKELKEKF